MVGQEDLLASTCESCSEPFAASLKDFWGDLGKTFRSSESSFIIPNNNASVPQ